MQETKLNIVIADDDKDDQLLLLDAFKDSEILCNSVSVYNGKQLLDYLLCRSAFQNHSHFEPDLIFLDINMPVQNGLEALKEIKASENLKDIPVYIFSTGCSRVDQDRAMALGAAKCFSKPGTYDEIKKIVQEVVSYSL